MAGSDRRRFAQQPSLVMADLAHHVIRALQAIVEHGLELGEAALAARRRHETCEQAAALGLELARALPIAAVERGLDSVGELQNDGNPLLHG